MRAAAARIPTDRRVPRLAVAGVSKVVMHPFDAFTACMLTPSPALPQLDIQLFGRFAVLIDGVAVDERRWARRSAQTLVKLLALTSARTLHREQLTEVLWPGQTPEAGLNSLNKAIHAARRALEPGLVRGALSRFLLTPGNQVVLASPGGLSVDLLLFEAAAHQAIRGQDAQAAREALSLCGGTLLIDNLYEPWAQARRALVQQLFRTTALAAVRLSARRQEHGPGMEIARRLILDDPTDEAAHLMLMQLHASTGQRSQALRQYDLACTALAAAELHPGPELQALADDLRRPPETMPSGALARDAEVDSPGVAGPAWSPRVGAATFHNGIVKAARLWPDGRSALVSANWHGDRFDLHRLVLATGETERLPWPVAALLAVSPAGDLALGLNPSARNSVVDVCTLAVVPAAGGEPVALLEGVQYADWHPGTVPLPAEPLKALAVVRDVDGRSRLDFPAGTARFVSAGWISHVRFSPDGRHLACIDHPIDNDDEGDVVVVDLEAGDGAPRVLARDFLGVQGLAWRDGQVWFTAARRGLARALRSVTLAGDERLMFQDLGNLKLHNAAADGRLLVAAERLTVGTAARHATDAAERDISWHDYTTPRDISADGRLLVVEESYTAGRHDFGAFLRALDGSRTRALADGVPLVLSPDGGTVILRRPAARTRLTVLDVATRALRHLPNDDAAPVVHSEFVSFFPDGRRIAFAANDRAGGPRIYMQDLDGGLPVCLRPGESGLRMPWNRAVSPDGTRLVLLDADDRLCLVPTTPGGQRQPLALSGADVVLVAWHAGGQAIFVCSWAGVPCQVDLYDLHTHRRQAWLALAPPDAGPVRAIRRLRMTADGLSYAYAFSRERSDLYLFEDD